MPYCNTSPEELVPQRLAEPVAAGTHDMQLPASLRHGSNLSSCSDPAIDKPHRARGEPRRL